jgi:hypothetical protein
MNLFRDVNCNKPSPNRDECKHADLWRGNTLDTPPPDSYTIDIVEQTARHANVGR